MWAHRVRGMAAAGLVAAGVLASGASARAQDVNVYGTESDYDAVVAEVAFCLDFDGSPGAYVSGDSFSSEVVFGSPEAEDATLVNWSSDAISDAGSTTSPNGVGPVSGVFTATANAFKLRFSSSGTPELVDLYDESDNLIGTVEAPNAAGFFGVVSGTPIKRFVIRPAVYDEGTGNLDRFFIDDFCVSNLAPDPEQMCADLKAAVEAADASSFGNAGKKGALLHKLDVICRRIGRGDAEGYCQAIQKLTRDVLPKTDGEGAPGDWVTDATLQQDLEDRIAALVAALQDAADALGGSPSDGGGDDGASAEGHGASRGRGHGNPGRGRGK